MMENDNTFFEVNGYKVHYEQFGSGPNSVLLIPGAIGTGRTDFEEMLDGEDEMDWDKFTVIAVEAPGWGRSRPPPRRYGLNVYNNDCECFNAIMQHLGYNKYSIIGWSEGAKVALLMAIKYRDCVESVVVTALSNKSSNKSLTAISATKSVDSWSKRRLDPYLKVYKTKEEIEKLWTRYLKFREHYNQYFPGDLFNEEYHLVRCPVLIIHGDQDPLIESQEPLDIYKKLSNARLHRFPKGEHDSHLKYSPQFTKLAQDHILNKNNNYTKTDPGDMSDETLDQILNNRIQL